MREDLVVRRVREEGAVRVDRVPRQQRRAGLRDQAPDVREQRVCGGVGGRGGLETGGRQTGGAVRGAAPFGHVFEGGRWGRDDGFLARGVQEVEV